MEERPTRRSSNAISRSTLALVITLFFTLASATTLKNDSEVHQPVVGAPEENDANTEIESLTTTAMLTSMTSTPMVLPESVDPSTMSTTADIDTSVTETVTIVTTPSTADDSTNSTTTSSTAEATTFDDTYIEETATETTSTASTDETTEMPSMSPSTDYDVIGSVDELAEDRDMMEAFYARYNSTTAEVDLVFVLDRSGSVPRSGWQAIVEFVKNVLEHFIVDKHNTRVAVVTYSTTASVDINDLEPGPVTDGETKCSLHSRLDRIVARRSPYGYTATHEALQHATKVLLDSRPLAKKAVIVITDGKSNIGPPPVRVAVDLLRLRWSTSLGSVEWNEQLYGPQVEIYAFGVADANRDELRSIASNLPGHLFTMATFNLFEQFAKSIHGDKQETNWVSADVGECHDACTGNHAHCMCGTKVGQYACICDPGYHLIESQCVPCEKGFFKESLSPDMCSQCPDNTTTNHEASTTRDQCNPLPGHVRCPPLPPVDNGRAFYVEGDIGDEVADTGIPCTGVTDGNSCHYVCETGYRLTGPPFLTCNYSGHWDGDVPRCQIVDCHQIDPHYETLVGATVQYLNGSTSYGSVVAAKCRQGTISVGRTVWECDHNGLWTCPADFKCHEVFCDALPLFGQLEVSEGECRAPRVPVDTECQLRCKGTGFQLIGPADYKCTFDAMTLSWQPDGLPTCKDSQPPKITCPKDIDVVVADWGDNSTIVHYDVQKPQATDNSGLVYYRVLGVPNLANHAFPTGVTVLTYEAYDDAGNRASCIQHVHVRARTVEVHNCPSNITVTVTSLRRTSYVQWDSPIFLGAGGVKLRHECSVKSGSEFSAATHHVICYALEYPAIKCQFYVSVVDPPCPIPFEDDPPANGALICGVMGHHYPKACRIHCREGYELRRQDALHKFVCLWDGTWTIDTPWPDCYLSRRPSKALTENQLFVRYQGSCNEARTTIAEAFVSTMSRLLSDEHGPCRPEFQCNVEEVRVVCGTASPGRSSPKTRRRRSASSGGKSEDLQGFDESRTAVVFLVTSAQLNRSVVSVDDQAEVMATLDVLSEAVWRQVTDGEVDAQPITQADSMRSEEDNLHHQLTVTEMHEVERHWEKIECRPGEVLDFERTSNICYSCPPGSYQAAAQCQMCPIGTYQNQDGSNRCRQCPPGTTTFRKGSRTRGECRAPCQPGHHSSTTLEPCLPCPVGTFQDKHGSMQCTGCPSRAPFTDVSSAATSLTQCYDYTECQQYNGPCDVIAGFRCIRFAYSHDVQCVCESEDGCPSVAMVTMTNETFDMPEKSSLAVTGEDVLETDSDEWKLNSYSTQDRIYSDNDGDDFDLVFRRPSASMRWTLTSLLNDFSVCTWVRPTPETVSVTSSPVAIVSLYGNKFAVDDHGVHISVYVGSGREPITAIEDQWGVRITIRPGWNHICASWSRLTAYWRFHVNGTSTSPTTSSTSSEIYAPLVGQYLRLGSTIVLGEQFVGELTQFGLYDHVLTDFDVSDMMSTQHADGCRPIREVAGNLLPWQRIYPLVMSSSRVFDYVSVRNRSRCLDPRSANDDESRVAIKDTCDPRLSSSKSCFNGGVCRLSPLTVRFACECPRGYSGERCAISSSSNNILVDPCTSNSCLNGGTCVMSRDQTSATCMCSEHWTGKHCQVSRTRASCALNPCVNNGTCIDNIPTTTHDDASPSYRCICPQPASTIVGANCEVLSDCDAMPCGRHGTCVTLADRTADTQSNGPAMGLPMFDRSYRCICDAGFEEPDCSRRTSMPMLVVPQQAAVAVKQIGGPRDVEQDFCLSILCQHGGTCRNDAGAGFVCVCTRDYTGKYCSVMRYTETKRYRVSVTLKINYTSDLYYDSVFQELFRLQIHQLLDRLTGDNKLYIIVDDIRVKGDKVSVDFFLIFTRYTDTTAFTTYDVTKSFERHLEVGRIGKFTATSDDFTIQEIHTESGEGGNTQRSIGEVRDVMFCIMAGVAILCLVSVLVLREWRRHRLNSSSLVNGTRAAVENNYVARRIEKSRDHNGLLVKQHTKKDNLVNLERFLKPDSCISENNYSSNRDDQFNVFRVNEIDEKPIVLGNYDSN